MDTPGRRTSHVDHASSLTISIDVEFAWGRCDHPYPPDTDRSFWTTMAAEHVVVDRLLELFARYRIRATWAVVGHLLREQPMWELLTGQTPSPIPDADRELWRAWLFQLPPTPDPLWCSPDVVARIGRITPPQEIGSHAFAHIPYDEQVTPASMIDADLALQQAVGLQQVIVFPRNRVGFLSRVRQAGFQVYRGLTPRWYHRLPSRILRRLGHFLEFALALPPPLAHVHRDPASGMLNVPDSLLLLGRQGIRRWIPRGMIFRMARIGMERAVRQGGTFHLWFHPSNFTTDMEVQLALLERILRHADGLRARGLLEIRTMGDHVRDNLAGHHPAEHTT